MCTASLLPDSPSRRRSLGSFSAVPRRGSRPGQRREVFSLGQGVPSRGYPLSPTSSVIYIIYIIYIYFYLVPNSMALALNCE